MFLSVVGLFKKIYLIHLFSLKFKEYIYRIQTLMKILNITCKSYSYTYVKMVVKLL